MQYHIHYDIEYYCAWLVIMIIVVVDVIIIIYSLGVDNYYHYHDNHFDLNLL